MFNVYIVIQGKRNAEIHQFIFLALHTNTYQRAYSVSHIFLHRHFFSERFYLEVGNLGFSMKENTIDFSWKFIILW